MPALDFKPRQKAPGGSHSQRWIVAGVCLFLVVITWMVFGQTLNHAFINYDDNKYVYENAQVSRGLSSQGVLWALTHSYGSNWHPLTAVSQMLDCQLFGLKPAGHHFTNVLLHAIATVLLFLVLLEMTGGLGQTGNTWRSAFVAALFAVHPLHVESVAWIAERKDVLSAVFFMLTLGAYVRYARSPSLARYVTMAILFTLGLMSKPMLVTVPFILLLLDYWPLQRQSRTGKLILEKVPLFILSFGSCAATIFAQARVLSSVADLALSVRVSNAVVSYSIYVWQMFWPTKLAVFYPHLLDQMPFPMIALSSVIVGGISLLAILIGRKRSYFMVGWFWYLIMLIPVIGLVQVGLQSHADRYTYLPHIGLYILVTWGIIDLAAGLRYRQHVLAIGAVIVIAILAWLAREQTKFWRNSDTLWRHALAVTKYNHVAHTGLGDFLFAERRPEEAIDHWQQAVAIRLDSAETHNKLGLGLFQIGKPNEAINQWKIALDIEPHNLNAQSNIAWVLATCPERAVRDGERAVIMMSDVIERSGAKSPMILRTLAAAYAEAGRFSDAIEAAQQALELAKHQGNSALATDLRANIDKYQLNIPLRDPSLTNVQP